MNATRFAAALGHETWVRCVAGGPVVFAGNMRRMLAYLGQPPVEPLNNAQDL